MRQRTGTSTPTSRRGRAVVATATGLACALALAVVPASAAVDRSLESREDAPPRIKGRVGPGFSISINQDTVPAGRYRLVVRDKGTSHNFHFTGAGVNRKTSVPLMEKKIWTVDLVAGTYTAACDPHSSMTTTLTVT